MRSGEGSIAGRSAGSGQSNRSPGVAPPGGARCWIGVNRRRWTVCGRECGIRIAECGVGNSEFGVRDLSYIAYGAPRRKRNRMRDTEFGIGSAECGVGNLGFVIWDL